MATSPFCEDIFLGLGSNLGDRAVYLSLAVERLSPEINVLRLSSLYETEPVGFLDQPPFLNAVCQVATTLEPLSLLALLKRIEAELGRIPTFRYGPRVIDIDILFYGDQLWESSELVIPHPRLAERAFVLVPLAEIAPYFIHPSRKLSIAQLVAALGPVSGVKRWVGESTWPGPRL